MSETLFGSDTPVSTDQNNGAPGITVGTRIRFTVAGTITGLRWWCPLTAPAAAQWNIVAYVSATDTSGASLASGSFGALTGGAWNNVVCNVAVNAGDEIVAEEWNSEGRYANTQTYFASDKTSGTLVGPADDAVTPKHNGRFNVGGSITFPQDGFAQNGYFVDILFDPLPSGTPFPMLGVGPGLGTPMGDPIPWLGTGAGPNAYTQALAGSVTASGALVRQVGKAAAGSITSAGALARQTNKAAAGSVTPAGGLTVIRAALVNVAGSITAAGALVRRPAKALAGTSTATGALARLTGKLAAGSTAAQGAVAKRTATSATGSTTATGAIAKRPSKALAGTTTPAGTIARSIGKSIAGAVTATGAIVKQIGRRLTGSATPTGALSINASNTHVRPGRLNATATTASQQPSATTAQQAGTRTSRLRSTIRPGE